MVSVVVVTHNSARVVVNCLKSIERSLPNAEIVVVDNASHDGSAALAEAAVAGVHTIELDENLGFGRACNLGVQAAQRPFVLFLNPDAWIVTVHHEAFARLLAKHPTGLVAPALNGQPAHLIAESSWSRELAAHMTAMLRPRELQNRRRKHVQAETAKSHIWFSAAMILVAREEFLNLGGFDARFFLYYEDRDLSRRYLAAGLPLVRTEALWGAHTGGASSRVSNLHAVPTAWGLLGWVQFLSIYDGERTARRAARAMLLTMGSMRVLMLAAGATGWKRARRKADQLEEVLRQIGERAQSDDTRFCPDALHILRSLVK